MAHRREFEGVEKRCAVNEPTLLKPAPIVGPRRHQFITPDKGTVLAAVLEAKAELGRMHWIGCFFGAEKSIPTPQATFSMN